MLALLLAGVLTAPVTHKTAPLASPCPKDLRWMLQYAAPNAHSESENENLLQMKCFRAALGNAFPTSYSIRGSKLSFVKYIEAYLAVYSAGPQASKNRYVTITGCVQHDCPNTGMLWIDTQTGGFVFAGSDELEPASETSEFHLWFATNLPDLNQRQFLNLPDEMLESLKSIFASERFVSVTVILPGGIMYSYKPGLFHLQTPEIRNPSK